MTISTGRTVAAILLSILPLAGQGIPVTERTLPNGLRVLMVERHNVPTISCGWVARVGSADERPGITGLAHLFEHMMFKGTRAVGTRDPKRDAELNAQQDQVMAEIRKEQESQREKWRRGEIADPDDPGTRTLHHQDLLGRLDQLIQEQRGLIVKDELDRIYKQFGATGMNANTNQDRTFYHIDVPSNKLELWAWLESDRLQNAVFREFYSERDVVLEERRLRVDSTPTGELQEAFMAMIWQAHPYGWPVIGWPSDITTVTRDQADAFFSSYYAPGNITLILVGDFKTEEAFATIQRYFRDIPSGGSAPSRSTTREPAQVGEQRLSGEADATPQVTTAFKTVPSVHRDSPALFFLSAILSGNSGRLNRELVNHRRVAVSVEAEAYPQRFAGLFFLTGVPGPGHLPEEVESLLYQEVERIQKDGVTTTEIQKVKNQVTMETCARMESNSLLRDQLAEAESAGTYQDFLIAPARLQGVTAEDVQRVARQYLVPANRTVLVIHRKESK